jgi:hypothetical protein
MATRAKGRTPRRTGDLAVLAIEQVAHGLSAGVTHFTGSLALVGIHLTLGRWSGGFGGTAIRANVGEAGFIRLQLELFRADGADFCWENHAS